MTLHIPKSTEVECPSGAYVDIINPQPDTILIEDIAHKLAQCNRFAGSFKWPYSVAQHAVFVSQRVEQMSGSLEAQMFALHHDDHEAYIGDTVRPAKEAYRAQGANPDLLADKLDEAIWQVHLIDYGSNFYKEEIKRADNFAMMVEARHGLPSGGRSWLGGVRTEAWKLHDLPKHIITPLYWLGEISWTDARYLYLSRHYYLKEALDANYA